MNTKPEESVRQEVNDSGGGEKETETGLHLHREKNLYRRNSNLKANEGKGKNPWLTAEMQIPLPGHGNDVQRSKNTKEVSESRCFWTECPKTGRSRREV